MFIHPKGNPSSDVWVIVDTPVSTDKEKGYLYSGGMGYAWDKIMREAGLPDYYVIASRANLNHMDAYTNLIGAIDQYKPRIIIPLDDVGGKICNELIPVRRDNKVEEDQDSEIEKYAGSILTSNRLTYSHYVIPTFGPQRIMSQYKLKDQVVSLDLAKAKDELEYMRTNGTPKPLPSRILKHEFECFDEILYTIDSFLQYPIISNDIECVYPKADSKYYKVYPGYPITVGLAPTKDFGISIDLFRESQSETIELWKRLNNLFKNVPQLGQNFFNFDINYYEMLGFEIVAELVQDTLIRHHVLWPELPHKLQFLTRQYTREPYYKDEGHGWSVKNMSGLKRYNCLDVCVTMEVYEGQEEEFKEKEHLR